VQIFNTRGSYGTFSRCATLLSNRISIFEWTRAEILVLVFIIVAKNTIWLVHASSFQSSLITNSVDVRNFFVASRYRHTSIRQWFFKTGQTARSPTEDTPSENKVLREKRDRENSRLVSLAESSDINPRESEDNISLKEIYIRRMRLHRSTKQSRQRNLLSTITIPSACRWSLQNCEHHA